jgi:hypothetical protein
MKLAIVTSYFNPCGYHRLYQNIRRFIDGLGGATERLHVSALSIVNPLPETLPGTAFDELLDNGMHAYYFSGKRPEHMLWQKERMLNYAIANLPAEYDAVAWVDADVLFQDSGWVEQAEVMLADFPVIQLFKLCNHLEPSGRVEQTRPAVVHSHQKGAAWGMAWAARREVLADGLLDWLITGAGDAFMADAWLRYHRPNARMSSAMASLYRPWAEKQGRITGGRVHHLPGTIDHLWHGAMENRRYEHRNRLLTRCQFDPLSDIVADGPLYRWANPSGGLATEVIEWFEQRLEDG